MGTSYSSAAAETLRKWTAACLISTKSQNTYTVKGKAYFWESSNREHDDGAITGSVYRVTETRSDGREMVRPAGAFRINGDGAGENVLDVTYDESHVKMQKATI